MSGKKHIQLKSPKKNSNSPNKTIEVSNPSSIEDDLNIERIAHEIANRVAKNVLPPQPITKAKIENSHSNAEFSSQQKMQKIENQNSNSNVEFTHKQKTEKIENQNSKSNVEFMHKQKTGKIENQNSNSNVEFMHKQKTGKNENENSNSNVEFQHNQKNYNSKVEFPHQNNKNVEFSHKENNEKIENYNSNVDFLHKNKTDKIHVHKIANSLDKISRKIEKNVQKMQNEVESFLRDNKSCHNKTQNKVLSIGSSIPDQGNAIENKEKKKDTPLSIMKNLFSQKKYNELIKTNLDQRITLRNSSIENKISSLNIKDARKSEEIPITVENIKKEFALKYMNKSQAKKPNLNQMPNKYEKIINNFKKIIKKKDPQETKIIVQNPEEKVKEKLKELQNLFGLTDRMKRIETRETKKPKNKIRLISIIDPNTLKQSAIKKQQIVENPKMVWENACNSQYNEKLNTKSEVFSKSLENWSENFNFSGRETPKSSAKKLGNLLLQRNTCDHSGKKQEESISKRLQNKLMNLIQNKVSESGNWKKNSTKKDSGKHEKSASSQNKFVTKRNKKS